MYLLFLQCKFGETKHNPTTPYIRINLRWTSNYKVKIIKFLKENRRVSLQPWYRQSFLKEKTENTYLRGKHPRIHKTALLRIFIEKPQTAKMLAAHLRKEWNSGTLKKLKQNCYSSTVRQLMTAMLYT